MVVAVQVGLMLADPIVVEVAGTPTLLSHGDAWCTLDVAYQRFRATVRQPAFQRDFLSKTLDERIAFARGLRMQSDSEKSMKAADICTPSISPSVLAMPP